MRNCTTNWARLLRSYQRRDTVHGTKNRPTFTTRPSPLAPPSSTLIGHPGSDMLSCRAPTLRSGVQGGRIWRACFFFHWLRASRLPSSRRQVLPQDPARYWNVGLFFVPSTVGNGTAQGNPATRASILLRNSPQVRFCASILLRNSPHACAFLRVTPIEKWISCALLRVNPIKKFTLCAFLRVNPIKKFTSRALLAPGTVFPT